MFGNSLLPLHPSSAFGAKPIDMKIKKELKIGLYLIASTVALYWGLNFLKGKDIFGKSHQLYAVFENVQGLQQTSNIYIRGLKVGTIEKIEFDEDNNSFLVTLSVDSKYSIPLDTKAVIYSTDLLGSKAIKLELSNRSESHQSGDMLASGIEGDLTSVLAGLDPIKNKMNTVLDQLNTTLSGLNSVLNKETTDNLNKGIENFKSITQNLNSVSSTVDELLKGEKGSISALVGNVEQFTQNLKSNNDNINTIISNLAGISETLAEAKLGELVNNLDGIIAKLKNGEGTLGKALTNDSLYLNLVNATGSLNLLLEDLKENPGRYVQISVFGRKNKH